MLRHTDVIWCFPKNNTSQIPWEKKGHSMICLKPTESFVFFKGEENNPGKSFTHLNAVTEVLKTGFLYLDFTVLSQQVT